MKETKTGLSQRIDGQEETGASGEGVVTVRRTERLRRLRDAIADGLVERDLAVRLALLAALSGEHLLLLGAPGTAKSLVARRLRLAFDDATYFERLLTRFTVPEEMFGPLSILGLQEDRYERLTESYLPKASIAFLDEIFKANSAILNALLTLLNEREFDNGTRREATPLVAVIGASNELPDGEELDALLDRFLLRLHVEPVSEDGFRSLLELRDAGEPSVPKELKLTRADLDLVMQEAESVDIPGGVLALLGELRQWCMAEDIQVSDRRWRKITKLLRTAAWTNGRTEVVDWDCWLLQHCIGERPDERRKVYEWYEARVGAVASKPEPLIRLIESLESRLKKDENEKVLSCDEEGNRLYRLGNGKTTQERKGQAYRGGAPLFLAPDNADMHRGRTADRTNGGDGYTRQELLELHMRSYYRSDWEREVEEYIKDVANHMLVPLDRAEEQVRHPRIYVQSQVAQLEALRSELDAHRQSIRRQMGSLRAELENHLWVTPGFAGPAGRRLQEQLHEAERLTERLDVLARGYQALPTKADVLAEEPPAG